MIYTCTFNPSIDYKIDVDQFIEGDLNRVTKHQFVAGGKGINVSIVLRNLGIENIPTGFCGGFTGNFITTYLFKTYNLKSSFIEITDVTRINVKVNHNGTETELNGNGPVVTDMEMQQLLALFQGLTQGDILIIGGSTAHGAADSYLELVKLCTQKGIEFIIDTTKTSLLEILPYNPLLIKPNLKELCDLFNVNITSQEDIIKYAKELHKKGAKNVLVSLGKDGSIFVNSNVIYKATPITGTVQNTVGAGDSMVAGFIKGYVERKEVFEQFKTAVATGTATAFNTGLATTKDMENILEQVEIEVLEY